MVTRIVPLLAAAFLIVPVLAAEPDTPKTPPQPQPAPKLNQSQRSVSPGPAFDAPVTRSLRRPAPSGGDGGRPDETVGGLPGAKPAVPDKQP